MKKTLLIAGIIAAVIISGCKKEPKEYVYLGQLFYTWSHASQEKIKGKVKEFKQLTFWAAEENGNVVKGKQLTVEERKSLGSMGPDFKEEFSPSGTVLRHTTFDENGNVIGDFKATSEDAILTQTEYYTKDTLRAKYKFRYDGNKIGEITILNPANDTVFMSSRYEYDPNGWIIRNQTFNYKSEPQGYAIRTRNEAGQETQVQSFTREGKLNSQFDYVYNDKGERTGHHQQNFTSNEVIEYTFTYKYDKMGNYTAIIFYKDGKPFLYRTREITYYD